MFQLFLLLFTSLCTPVTNLICSTLLLIMALQLLMIVWIWLYRWYNNTRQWHHKVFGKLVNSVRLTRLLNQRTDLLGASQPDLQYRFLTTDLFAKMTGPQRDASGADTRDSLISDSSSSVIWSDEKKHSWDLGGGRGGRKERGREREGGEGGIRVQSISKCQHQTCECC